MYQVLVKIISPACLLKDEVVDPIVVYTKLPDFTYLYVHYLIIMQWLYPGEKEHVFTWYIVVNTWISHKISRVISHSTTLNHSFPVQSKTKVRKERFDLVRI